MLAVICAQIILPVMYCAPTGINPAYYKAGKAEALPWTVKNSLTPNTFLLLISKMLLMTPLCGATNLGAMYWASKCLRTAKEAFLLWRIFLFAVDFLGRWVVTLIAYLIRGLTIRYINHWLLKLCEANCSFLHKSWGWSAQFKKLISGFSHPTNVTSERRVHIITSGLSVAWWLFHNKGNFS